MRVGILLFDDVDLLDAGGPYEVFLTANRLAERAGHAPPFEVVTVGVTGETVIAFGGMRLTPELRLDQAAPLDLIVMPGAVDIDRVLADRSIVAASHAAPVVASVCTGAFVLAEAGLLEGKPWTTHWEDVDGLADRSGSSLGSVARWVDAGEVVTAGGLSQGIAMALHLVDRFAGRDLAVATARQIDYAWNPDVA